MSTDQTPALARATEALDWLHATECECWQEDDGGVAEDCEQVRRERAAKVVSAALHDPDDDVIARALARRWWDRNADDTDLWDDLTEAEQANVIANVNAADLADAVRAAILGEA